MIMIPFTGDVDILKEIINSSFDRKAYEKTGCSAFERQFVNFDNFLVAADYFQDHNEDIRASGLRWLAENKKFPYFTAFCEFRFNIVKFGNKDYCLPLDLFPKNTPEFYTTKPTVFHIFDHVLNLMSACTK